MTEGAVSSFSFNEIIAQIPVSVLWLTLVVFTALALILGLALVTGIDINYIVRRPTQPGRSTLSDF